MATCAELPMTSPRVGRGTPCAQKRYASPRLMKEAAPVSSHPATAAGLVASHTPGLQARTSPMARYDAMCLAIEAAYEVDEVKEIRDQAIVLEIYARQAHNVEAERRACEIRLRAERKAGKLSAELARSPGGRPGKTSPRMGRVSKAEALHKAGVSPKQAENWEKLAAVPEQEFEAALADRTVKTTTNGIIRAHVAPKRNPVSTEALWLWGTLRDFERDGLLAKEPVEILSTMTPSMLDDVHALAPRVAAWLRRIGREMS
jgi:transcriptional regulator with XRE-family HTH domain